MSAKPMVVNITFRVEVGYHRSPEELAQLVTKIKALVDGFNEQGDRLSTSNRPGTLDSKRITHIE
jgi:hypothetical protein